MPFKEEPLHVRAMSEAGSPAALLDAVTSLRSSFARLELRSQALAQSRRRLRDRGVERALSKPAQAHAEDQPFCPGCLRCVCAESENMLESECAERTSGLR